MISRAHLSALLPLLLAACSTPAPQAPPPAAIQVVDAAGQALALGGPPARVVAAGKGLYMPVHVFAMFPGALGRLAAVEARGDATSFISQLDPGPDGWVDLAHDPGVEAIAALHPDLVLAKGTVEDEHSTTLARVGIPTLHLGLETPERFLQDVALLGQVLGEPARAEAISAFYSQRLERIAAAVGPLAEAARPRVLVLGMHARGGKIAVKVPAKAWMQTQQVALAGGRPVWLEEATVTDGWTIVGFEQIAAWDPDVLVVCIPHDMEEAAVMADLASDERWGHLQAVQNDRLLRFPHDLYDWNSPDPRWLLGLIWLAGQLHPRSPPEAGHGRRAARLLRRIVWDRARAGGRLDPA
ncbi:MAG: ABC transporter substrate-binding protein [Pseudomonadota bacterium]